MTYQVNLTFFDDMVRFEVSNEGMPVVRSLTLVAPLLSLCLLGIDYAVEATIPALPAPLTIKVNNTHILVQNPVDEGSPILFDKADFIEAVVRGKQHGEKKQIVEGPDTHVRPTQDSDL